MTDSAWEDNLARDTKGRWLGAQMFHGFGYGGVQRFHRTCKNDVGENFIFLEVTGPEQHSFEGLEGRTLIEMSIVCPSAVKRELAKTHILNHGEDSRKWGAVPQVERAVWMQEYGMSARAKLGMIKRQSDNRTLEESYDPDWLEENEEEFWDIASDYAEGVLGLLGMFLDMPQNQAGDRGWAWIAWNI